MTDRSEAWAWAVDGRMRNTDGQPIVEYQGGAHVDGGCWVQLVDVWPEGKLQAQLDRIEAKLAAASSLIISPDGEWDEQANRWAAFTDDELAALDDCIWTAGQEDGSAGEHLPQVTTDLHVAIRAELERRKP